MVATTPMANLNAKKLKLGSTENEQYISIKTARERHI